MADEFEARSAAFTEWFKSLPKAHLSPKIALADYRDRGAGRGVKALADITKDEELFRVARTSVISVENSTIPANVLAGRELSEWTCLIVVLIYEYLQGNKSPWKPYFDVLPTKFDTPMFWSERELSLLQASAMVEKIGKTFADTAFRAELIPTINKNKEIFYPTGTEALNEEALLALAHRMASTVMAYAFDLDEDKDKGSQKVDTTADQALRDKLLAASEMADLSDESSEASGQLLPKGMVPMADMLNAEAENNANMFHEADMLVMRAVKPIAKGDEVFNDYGKLPRSDLLRRYGYVTPQYAPFDCAELPFDLVIDTAQELYPLTKHEKQRRMVELQAWGQELLADGYTVTRPPNTEGWHGAPTFFEPDLHELTLTFVDATDGADGWQTDAENTRRFRAIMAAALAKRLSHYPTSIAQDEALLADPEWTQPRHRAAVEVRLGEKRVLQEAREWVLRGLQGENGDAPARQANGKRKAEGEGERGSKGARVA